MRRIAFLCIAGMPLVGGCSPEPQTGPAQPVDLLAPPPPGTGVQYRMTTHLEPGQEVERCQLFQAPPEGLSIQRDEVAFTPGSHHIVLYKTPYTELPTETIQGDPIDGTQVHDCSNSPFSLWRVDGLAGGTQSLDGDTILGRLPDGVALKVRPNAVFVMNVHYLNASSEPLDVEAAINLHTIPNEDVVEEAGVTFYFNDFIRVPANGQASARMRCPLPYDISLVRVQSHMHRHGVNFVAHHVTDGAGTMEEIYSNTNWENVPAKNFDPPLSITAGQALDFQCDYVNPEAHDVMQGLTTADEMCVLLGVYYPVDTLVENCMDQNGFPADIWIGSGAATCAETMSCVAQATPTYQDKGSSLFGCIVDSCPGAAVEVSDVMRCQMTDGFDACTTACSGAGTDCGSCIATACGSQISACQAAACN